MGGATAYQPKCLTVLFGKTLLRWQREALLGAGIEKVAIVRGYMAQKLAFDGIATFDNPRWAETNMVASLACASSWLSTAPCLVSYSDIIYPPSTIEVLAKAEGDIVITYFLNWRQLWEQRFQDPLSDVETFRIDASGRLLEIGARPRTLDEVQGQYMGLLRFTPDGWRSVEALLEGMDAAKQDKLDVTAMLQFLLERGVRISTVPVEQPWYEVDSQSDLELYQVKAERNGGLF